MLERANNINFKETSRKLLEDKSGIVGFLLKKTFNPFSIENRFAINAKTVDRSRFAEDSNIELAKEFFIFPNNKKYKPFCIAIIMSNSSYKILLNEKSEKTTEFYDIVTEFLSLLIKNKRGIMQIIMQDDDKITKSTAGCIALTSAILRLPRVHISPEPPSTQRPSPPTRVKPQEGNCAVTTTARSPSH